jgi:hypothetical protein
MKTYTVYIKQSDDDISHIEYVPEKFSWTGFLFNSIWLIYNRLWSQAFLFLAILILIYQLELAGIIAPNISLMIWVGISFFIGFTGNDMLRRRLERRGYKFSDIIIASSESEAELKFICQNYKEGKFDA